MTFLDVLNTLNMMASAVVVILAFSLLGYTMTYNFRTQVARYFALVLVCVIVVYAGDIALERVMSAESAQRWLRFQWLGIAWTPAALYLFSLAALATTNYRIQRRRWIAIAAVVLSGVASLDAIFGNLIVGAIRYTPPLSYLEAGPLFGIFAVFFATALILSLANIWKGRQRCLTENSRKRMTYLLLAFMAPGVGVFPYLVAISRLTETTQSSALVLIVSLIGNLAVAFMLLLMSYTVAYFGVLTPDRVVRYRLIRFFMRGPVVAILVILAIMIVPKVESIVGLPRDVVLFGAITSVIIFSQLFLSITKTLVDRLVYRGDRDEIAWLRELDRRLLATSDMRELLENNLIALCELLRVPSGFIAAIVGPDLTLEAVVGPDQTRDDVLHAQDWPEALSRSLRTVRPGIPHTHAGFWIWPLAEPAAQDEQVRIVGLLGVQARTTAPILSEDELEMIQTMLDRMAEVLADRRLQQTMLASLRYLMPDIERVQRLRRAVPYATADSEREPAAAMLDPSPIHSPEFEAWVKDALSHYWGGPKLTRSPLIKLRVVGDTLSQADDDPTKALRLVLGQAIERLRPDGKQNFTAPEWLLYNILELRFIQGRKVREIADRLAVSESDLYRKQRVAIGHLARVLSEMEQENGVTLETTPQSVSLNGHPEN